MNADELLPIASGILGVAPRAEVLPGDWADWSERVAAWQTAYHNHKKRQRDLHAKAAAVYGADEFRFAVAVGDLFCAAARNDLPPEIHDAIAALAAYVDETAPGYVLDRLSDEIQTGGAMPVSRFPGVNRNESEEDQG